MKIWKQCIVVLYGYSRFKLYVKSENNYAYLVRCVETRFGAFNYEVERSLPTGENEKGLD